MGKIPNKYSCRIIVIGQIPPPHHGSNVMTKIFCQAIDQIGYEYTLAQKKFSNRIDEIGKLSIIKLLNTPKIVINILLKIIKFRPNICIYFLSVKPPSLYFDLLILLTLQMFNYDIILYLHGKGYEKIWHKSNRYIKIYIKSVLSKCLGAIVLGEALKSDINRFIPDKRLSILPNCIKDRIISLPKVKMKKYRKLKVLYLSNLIPSKGPIEFLKMAKKVSSIKKNVEFILAGGESPDNLFNQKVKSYIHNNDLAGKVKMTGAVYGDRKEKLFLDSDIFVFPTFFDLETFGLVNLEAMRSGLPVVTSSEGCIPEVVKDGINGFIIDPKNIDEMSAKILELINDKKLRYNMGSESKKLFKNKYTYDVYKDNLKLIIHNYILLSLRN